MASSITVGVDELASCDSGQSYKPQMREEEEEGDEDMAIPKAGPLVLKCFGKFCQVDLYGGQCDESIKVASRKHSKRKLFLKNSLQDQLSKWPNLIRIFYAVCCLRLTANICYQYHYDFHLARIQHYHPNVDTGHDNLLLLDKTRIINKVNTSTIANAIRDLEAAKSTLISIGAPYLEATFAIECAYIFLLLISLIVYVATQVYFNFVRPFDYSLIRAILDWKQERMVLNKLIRQEVDKFLVSSFNYTRVCVNQLNSFTGKSSMLCQSRGDRIVAMQCGEPIRVQVDDDTLARKVQIQVDRLRQRHSSNVRRLNEFVAESKLMPYNRSSVWLAKVSHYYCLFTATSIVYIIGFAICCFFVLPLYYGFKIRFEKMDILVEIETISVVIFATIPGVFYISLILTICVDQSRLILDIRGRIELFTVSNYASFSKTKDSTIFNCLRAIITKFRSAKLSQEQLRQKRVDLIHQRAVQVLSKRGNSRRMNDELFKLVLDYKIFVAQLKTMQNSFGFIALMSLLVALIMPVVGRLHVPYLQNNIKLLSILVSGVCLTFSDLCMIPVCHLYSRCLDLYKSLSSLLAHVIDVTGDDDHSMLAAQDLWANYDEHLIWIIRKELNHPDRLKEQFATIGLGLLFTYQNLIRIHFWLGLIVLSILVETSGSPSDREFLSRIFSDPLGIFQ